MSTEGEARRDRINTDVLKFIFRFESAVTCPRTGNMNILTSQYLLIYWISVYVVLYSKRSHPPITKSSRIQNYQEHNGKISQTPICRFQTPSDMKSLCGIYGNSLSYLSPENVESCISAVNLFTSSSFATRLIGHRTISP